ncbi:lysine transporter LysE [Terasakiispira papahanaumokuakeensis]|uniref:Lysine transporter LysE n=1 Tax=Terasakiispira papahanaumokuakeensis TaxID=197479 RepID=A0A1E2V9R7_9GAMM|nr:LysE family translocator [Terasakiispira papahanaumokuakeensis]ODC03750.1 lysine transporter LysE [Terasakiispira papahanaumokuakeensis]
MLDYSWIHWSSFFIAAFLLNMSPGPDMAFIVGQTLKRGTRGGLCALGGIWSGALVHVLAAAFGLSAVLMASATLFSVVKWLGAAYLIWLGIQSLCSQGSRLSGEGAHLPSNLAVWRQGFLVSVLNPKVAIFFMAFLPQFVVPGAGAVSLQLLVHGLLIIAVAALVEPLVVFGAASIRQYLQRHSQISCWMDRGLGALLIGLGVKLAMFESDSTQR